MNARALLSLLFHADKALDLLRAAAELGLLERLDAGPVSLQALASPIGARPLRLYKFLDGLETLGLVVRHQSSDDLFSAEYKSVEPLVPAVAAVLGERAVERDRNEHYPWREVHGRLGEVLAGGLNAHFAWPPRTAEAIRSFEQSMAIGTPPIVEALRNASPRIFRSSASRWLDVGGGDGAVAVGVLDDPTVPSELTCDVLNLPPIAPLVRERAIAAGLERRVHFVGGDFLATSLPRGYDVLSYIRVLHDWPADVARKLLIAAREALAPGARLVICEEFRTQERLAAQFFWTYFLIGVDTCVSRLREADWYVQALYELGFIQVQVIPGAFDIIVAIRV